MSSLVNDFLPFEHEQTTDEGIIAPLHLPLLHIMFKEAMTHSVSMTTLSFPLWSNPSCKYRDPVSILPGSRAPLSAPWPRLLIVKGEHGHICVGGRLWTVSLDTGSIVDSEQWEWSRLDGDVAWKLVILARSRTRGRLQSDAKSVVRHPDVYWHACFIIFSTDAKARVIRVTGKVLKALVAHSSSILLCGLLLRGLYVTRHPVLGHWFNFIQAAVKSSFCCQMMSLIQESRVRSLFQMLRNHTH